MEAKANRELITSIEAAKILGVSRQRIQQMVVSRQLPPRYVFNKDSKRKLYVFEKKTILLFLNHEYRKEIEWVEPEESSLMSVPELSVLLGSGPMWIYDATKKERLIPELIVGNDKMLCLYDREKAIEVWEHRKDCKKTVHRDNTVLLIDKIRELHSRGLNDSEIARETESKQPLIAKLRKEIGLISNASRGRKSGYLPETIELIEKIKEYYNSGMNDSEISVKIGKSLALVARLRRNAGLSSSKVDRNE